MSATGDSFQGRQHHLKTPDSGLVQYHLTMPKHSMRSQRGREKPIAPTTRSTAFCAGCEKHWHALLQGPLFSCYRAKRTRKVRQTDSPGMVKTVSLVDYIVERLTAD